MRKINRIIITFILLFSVFLNFNYVSVYAHGSFVFKDIKNSDYYFESISKMYDKGYVKGFEDGTFKPRDNITIAESLTMLFRIAGINTNEMEEQEYWYSNVIEKSIEMGIVNKEVDPLEKATRLDISKYIIKLYQLDTSVVDIENVFLDSNALEVNTMYYYGIFCGVPAEGGVKFLPTSNIIRGDITIVFDRISETLKSPHSSYIEIGPYQISKNPTTEEDFLEIFEILGKTDTTSLSIPYDIDLTDSTVYLDIRKNIISAYSYSFARMPEYFSFTPGLNIKRTINSKTSGNIRILLVNSNISNDEIIRMKKEFNRVCEEIIEELYSSKIITKLSTDREKAEVFYKFIALHCTYDVNYGINSFTGYGAAVERLATCQGYAAMFNKLCSLQGIDSYAITGYIKETEEPHMWNAFFDSELGDWVYCDVTFGDPITNEKDYYTLDFFGLTEEEINIDRIVEI